MPKQRRRHSSASMPEGTTARRRRGKGTTARNIELYSSAYRIAWKRISSLRKREQPNIALRLHASIRRQLKKGATDPRSIATEALKAVDEGTGRGTPKPRRCRSRHFPRRAGSTFDWAANSVPDWRPFFLVCEKNFGTPTRRMRCWCRANTKTKEQPC
jgi:hypothetical protein